MKDWLRRIWNGNRRDNEISRSVPPKPRDPDAELAELAALIESGDASEVNLERVADLFGQSDPNRHQFQRNK